MHNDALRFVFVFILSLTQLCSQAQSTRYTTEELLGQFDASAHPDFSIIPNTYTRKTNIYLRKRNIGGLRIDVESRKRRWGVFGDCERHSKLLGTTQYLESEMDSAALYGVSRS